MAVSLFSLPLGLQRRAGLSRAPVPYLEYTESKAEADLTRKNKTGGD